MAIQPPDPTDMARIADRYGLGLAEDDLAQFGPVVEGLLSSWDVVAELYAQSAPTPPERAWTRPRATRTRTTPGTSPPTSPKARRGR
jgi:amidase